MLLLTFCSILIFLKVSDGYQIVSWDRFADDGTDGWTEGTLNVLHSFGDEVKKKLKLVVLFIFE